MLYPSINILRTKADSKYTLVSLAAKRARDLIDGKPVLIDPVIDKPVSIATAEIAEDLITYARQFETEEEAAEYEARLAEEASEADEAIEEVGEEAPAEEIPEE